MDRTSAWRASTIQEDFAVLRERREARSGRERPQVPPLLGPVARWMLAVVPVALSWVYLEVTYLSGGFGLLVLGWRGAHLGATFGLLWILLRAPRVARRGRVAGLMQVGLSAGAFVVGFSAAIGAMPFVGLFLTFTVMGAVAGSVEAGALAGVFLIPAFIPLAVTLVCGSDATRLVRRLRVAPLGWRECGWLLLGLGLSLPVALVALLPYWVMYGQPI